MSFAADEITHDAFLGGRVTLAQPRKGYRAGVDPVLLAAFVTARAGQSVLDLGCGVGAASLCLAARVPGLDLTGVERDPGYAALARLNGPANSAGFSVVEADIATLPAALRQTRFDHVIANPPYYRRDRGSVAPDASREAALGEETPLRIWVDVATRRLAPKGYVHFILRADRLPDLLQEIDSRLGSLEILPLCPRVGRPAELVLLRGRAGGRAPFVLHAPLVLHQGAEHVGDRDDYAAPVRAVLREGAALQMP